MQRLIACAFTSIIVVGLTSCAGPDAALVEAADDFANRSVGPEYLQYVEADPNLDETDKRVRRTNVATFRQAVEAAKN